jgi:hypothetical protein
MRWAGNVASKTQNRNPTVVKRKILKEADSLEDIDVDGRIMLKRVVKK